MITSYDYRSCYENDLVSLVGGGQRWYGELFDIDLEQTFNFSVPNITDDTISLITSECIKFSGNSSEILCKWIGKRSHLCAITTK